MIWGRRQEKFRKIRTRKIEPDWIHPGNEAVRRAPDPAVSVASVSDEEFDEERQRVLRNLTTHASDSKSKSKPLIEHDLALMKQLSGIVSIPFCHHQPPRHRSRCLRSWRGTSLAARLVGE